MSIPYVQEDSEIILKEITARFINETGITVNKNTFHKLYTKEVMPDCEIVHNDRLKKISAQHEAFITDTDAA